jgi:hypothetical protein
MGDSMKAALLPAMLLCFAGSTTRAEAANWVIATAPGAPVAIYYDSLSIARSGTTATIWVLYDYSSPYTDSGETYSSAVIQMTIDCAARMITSSSNEVDYAGRMQGGAVVARHPEAYASQKAIVPGSANDSLYHAACG